MTAPYRLPFKCKQPILMSMSFLKHINCKAAALLLCLALIVGCVAQPDIQGWWPFQREEVVRQVKIDFERRDIEIGAPAYIRIFKEDAILQLWLRDKQSQKYALYKTYPICTFSGKLGPKLREGDLQSPEGFYYVTEDRLNPNSAYHLSFNIGFPNVYDRKLGRTGSLLMVHGGCKSEGCYAMTDAGIEEIYAIVELALNNGQDAVPIHIFPFHMTNENMQQYADSTWAPFWWNLKQGYDLFEVTKMPPSVYTQNGRYVFNKGGYF
jgi:murein L,D-transpeptidase YafK